MMLDSYFYPLIQYGWLLPPLLFLFGSIKLYQTHTTLGRRLLIIGFGLLAVNSAVMLAQFLEIFQIYYHPMNDSHGSGAVWFEADKVGNYDKWLYWGIFMIKNCGYLIAAAGFILESRWTPSEPTQTPNHPSSQV